MPVDLIEVVEANAGSRPRVEALNTDGADAHRPALLRLCGELYRAVIGMVGHSSSACLFWVDEPEARCSRLRRGGTPFGHGASWWATSQWPTSALRNSVQARQNEADRATLVTP